jgi:class 3 adenylate cyclase
VAAWLEIGVLARRQFARVFRAYERAALEQPPSVSSPARLVPGGEARLARARDQLASMTSPQLASRVVDTIAHGDELELAQLRPYALADSWSAPRREVLEACLHAVRAGALEMRWSVLCPQCRGPVQQRDTLGALDVRDVHCESCGVGFGADFDRSIELRFRPSPSVRAVEDHDFCVGGPEVTPHIVAQQLLHPGERRTVHVRLEPGRHRLRSAAGSRFLAARAGGPATPDADGDVGLTASLELVNDTPHDDLVVLERAAWSDQAVTAAEMGSLQLFRDLFAREALRPGEQLAVGRVAVLFTDLRDSTRFYRQVGDAPAFGAVMSHFDVLRRAIDHEEGATVKTMGDAVMAVFSRPAAAIRAVRRAQSELSEPLVLKAGIHAGPSLAVTQNERLDYFGSTVNVAARLVGLSQGGDIVVSEDVLADPEVTDAVRELDATPIDAQLKGFEDVQFTLWRLTP